MSMSDEADAISLSILGKTYRVKCPQEKISELLESAQYFEAKLREFNPAGKIATAEGSTVITALNMVHEFLAQQKQLTAYIEAMNQRLRDLQSKLDEILARK
jgi:cell division protein ZapA